MAAFLCACPELNSGVLSGTSREVRAQYVVCWISARMLGGGADRDLLANHTHSAMDLVCGHPNADQANAAVIAGTSPLRPESIPVTPRLE